MRRANRQRTVRLVKLSVPGKDPGGTLTPKEIQEMMNRGILRSAHNLWLAERYLMDLSKLGYGEELDSQLRKLSEVAEFIEQEGNALITGKRL